MPTYTMTGPDGRVYQLQAGDDVPREKVEAELRRRISAQLEGKSAPTPAPTPTPAPAPRAAGTLGAAPLKEVEAPGVLSFLDYFTDREGAIKRDREYRAYLQDKLQRAELEDMKTQTGFFDRLGDLFSRGLLSARSGIKDVEAAIETDPTLKKQFTEEARRFAVDSRMEISGATTEQDVKDNFLRNVIPYIIEKGAESIPEMIAMTNPLGVLGVGLPANLGRQGRDAAELQGRQDVSGTDLAKVAPGAVAVTALDTLGLGGILAAPAKTALGRIGKAALLEGSTEAIQSAIEYANPRVVTGSDIDAGDMFEQSAFGFLAGGGIGGGLRGTGEAVAAPFRARTGAQTNQEAVINTAVRTEFQRLASQEVASVMAANPDLTQDAAVDIVRERAEELVQRAQENVVARAEQELAAEGETDVAADTGTAVDVLGGDVAGTAPDLGAVPPAPGAPVAGAPVGGGLAEAAPSVSVPAVGAGAGVSALAPTVDEVATAPVAAAIQSVTAPVAGPVPTIAQAAARETGITPSPAAPEVAAPEVPAPAPAVEFDPILLPIYEAPNMAERKKAAKPIINGIIDQTARDIIVPDKVANQIATQMAQRAAHREVFDPVEITQSVLTEQGIIAAPEVAAPPTAVGEELAARDQEVSAEMLAPEVQPTPTVAETATVEEAAPEVPVEAPAPFTAVPAKAEPTRENYTGPLSNWTPKLFRETSTDQLELFLPTGDATVDMSPELFMADTPELALGQGGNKGVLLEFDAGKLQGQLSKAKPTWEFGLTEGTGSEFIAKRNQQGAYKDALSAVRIAKGAQITNEQRERLGRVLNALEASGWSRTTTDNYVEYTRPATPTPEAAAPPGAPPVPPAPPPAIGGPSEPAPGGGGPVPPTDANVNAVVSAKLTKAQIKRLEEAAGIQRMKLSSMQKRIARSRSAEETMSLAGKLMLLARKPDDNVNILTSLFNSVPPPVLQALLAPLETGDVVRLGQRAGMENITRIDNMMRDEYIPYINRAMSRASKLAEKWKDFVSRSPEGSQAMSDVMFYSNMVNADPALAPTAAAYLKIDQEFQSLNAQLKAEKDPKKQATLKGQITKRRGEIQRLYFGATDADGTVIAGWNDVPAEGKQIFREARDYYRADFNEHYRLLMQRIDDAQFKEEDAARLKAAVDGMFKEASKRIIYFPLKRFGDYWVSVGKGKNSEFHMFESASEQDAFIARLRREGETREIDFSKGKDTLRLGLRKNTEDASAALKGIMDLLDSGGITEVDALKDHVFQMYLTALPEADMRRRFVHRQFKTGFSTDTLRTFANTAIASANQLGRLAYNYKFKNLIDQSYAETAGNPSKRRLDTITREMEMRIDTTLSSGPDSFWEQAANLGAKGTFLFLLSSPKSAIMNLTQLHVVGAPTLSAEFGEAATYGMMAKYTGQILTGQRIANPFRDENGDVRLQLPNFTAEGSAYIQGLRETDPDRYEAILKAWDYAREREVTESTFSSAANVYERSAEPSSEMTFTQAARQGAVGTAALRATTNAVNAMGTLFHHTERMGREVMYMSAFELAYDRNLKQGMSPAAAGDAAMKQATELTNKGMFDFSSWNKSRAAKTPVGKLALQMRSYSLSMTSLLFRSFANMVGMYRTKAERLAAARVFFGVGAVTTLYGGFRASQFYVMAMLGYGFYEFLKDTLVGDDEDEEVEQGYLNPETIDRELMKYADAQGRELSKKDMDNYIRTVWIPETFGSGGTMQEALGLSDGVAKKLEAAADIGLPGVFGVDISNSVALTNLWHPVDTKSDDPEVEVYETLGRIGLGPSGALFVGAPTKFYKEANAGNFDKAIESIMPMAIRGFVKSQRLADEGLVVGKNRDVVLKDPSFYDAYSLTMQALGFPEAETSRAMQMDIKAGEIEKEIAGEKTALLDKRYRAVLDFERDQSEEAERNLRAIERDIEIYNLNYPSNAITNDTLKRSFEQKQQEAAEKMYGLGLDEKIPVRQPLVERREEEFVEGQ